MASANQSSPLLLLNNMSNLMSTKLDSTNYMIWKLQITAVLDAYSMLDHLDGSVPKPSQFLTTETGIQSVNPDFLIWNKKDKALLTLLYSTCSSFVLVMVVGKSSSQEVWNTLEERFTSTARSNVLNLKLELQSIKKAGNETVSSYLQRIKTVRDKLSAVGVHSDHEELTHVILKGLPKEFAPFASAIRTRDTILSLEKLTVLLQTEEQSMNEATESLSNSALAMFVSHNKPNFNGNQGFNRGRGRNSYSRGRRMNFAYQGKNPTTKLAAMASASNLHYTQNTETWLTDTGATDHITANANNLSPQAPYQGQEQVSVGNGQNLPIQNIDNNCSCYFDAKKFSIQDLPTGRILYKGLSNNGVYPIQSPLFIPAANKTACAAHSISSDKWHLWHSRLGHPSAKVLANVFPCFSPNSSSKDVKVHCHHCLAGKMHQLPFPTSNKTITSPFELVHADLWGPAPVVASNSFRFYLVFVDEFTKFTWVYLLKHKSNTFQVFTQFRSMIDTQFSLPIKILRTDCGGEFLSTPFTQFCLSKGILHHLSCPHTPQQNGVAERKHRHLVQCALALLSQSKLPMSYWSYAISTAAHLINKLPTPNLGNQSPWETLYHVSPDLTHLKTFGCECFPLLTPYTSHKLFPKTTPCVFIGYPLNTKGYYCLDPTTNRIYTSRHVLFNETVFPSLKHSNTNSAASTDSASVDSWLKFLLLQHTCSHNTVVISPSSHESSTIPSGQCPNLTLTVSAPDLAASYINPTEPNAVSVTDLTDLTASSTNPTEPNVLPLSTMPLPTGFTDNPAPTPTAHASPLPANTVPNTIPDNTTSTDIPIPTVVSHPMQTRSKSGIYKPKLTYAAIIDYAALQKQNTWSLVPLPSSKNVVGCKWVYKLKTHSDGTIARYKARLVAKGFHQQHGIDFNETFSPVIKPPTVRLVLSLAVSLNWPLRQLDVKNAFLHGTLNEEVYMTQPQGYIDPIHPHYVCKLQKSIYGLKQAPRAWFESFTTQLFHLGFIASNADSSLFIYTENKIIAYLLLYVDDIVLTSNTPTFLDTLIHKLSSVFDLKDLGSLHYFLGLQITRTPSRLYINQAKYAQDLLKKHNMLDCKPASSPSCPNTRLSLHDGDPLPDPHAYRSMVGALHYLTFTRPDISFVMHQVCQYMSTPTTIHLAAAKRILRYIRGSFNHGIEFTPGPLSLSGYTDIDWAGDPDDRRSTSGFLVYLGHNAITWSAKKQATVSRSSIESEYRALAIASAELCWVRSLLKDLGIYLSDPPILWCDNVSALAIASNPVFHARTKHIEVDFHFVRERVLRKDLVVKFVSTVDQLADIFTKSLSTHRFLELRRNLTVTVPKIEGGC
uniref:Integrase catalytic domain-containing protein n=1 Tax=Fagus sylvatica TaxID=28930 RepID=A0A2N9J0Y8_FAGSY